MPVSIVKKDITKIKCDAVVNATNEYFSPGGGVDAAIHAAAGKELFQLCQTLGKLEVGRVQLTPAYALPCKFIIHTVGPIWQGGDQNERELLESCYQEALKTAVAAKCKSIAFPLISSGTHGYPKEEVLKVALGVIKRFLYEYDLTVYVAVYDKEEYALNRALTADVGAYIDQHFEGNNVLERRKPISIDRMMRMPSCDRRAEALFESGKERRIEEKDSDFSFVPDFGSQGSILRHMYDGFALSLMKLIDEKGMDDVECYKKANVSRQTWHKILNDENYKPNKKTAISFAIALELNLKETQKLLETAGFILSKSSKFDIIIMYCIVKGIYDVTEIDSILFQYDQETLGGKL